MMRIGNGGLILNGIQRPGFVSLAGNCCPRRNVRFPAKCMASSSSSLEPNNYAILGLTPRASRSDVKSAYKKLALKYHPDVIRGDHVAQKQEKFKQIKSAYESLMKKIEEEEQTVTQPTESFYEQTVTQPTQSFYEQTVTQPTQSFYDRWDDWEESMGFEGGIPFPAPTIHS